MIKLSYLRPARKNEVVDWLYSTEFVNNDLVEIGVETLAEALIEKWDLIGPFSSPT